MLNLASARKSSLKIRRIVDQPIVENKIMILDGKA